MILIDIIKILEDSEIYAMNKVFYGCNDMTTSSRLYMSKDITQAVLDSIIELSEKLDIQVKVRWHYSNDSKDFDEKKGATI